jgi:hypothetical protein
MRTHVLVCGHLRAFGHVHARALVCVACGTQVARALTMMVRAELRLVVDLPAADPIVQPEKEV